MSNIDHLSTDDAAAPTPLKSWRPVGIVLGMLLVAILYLRLQGRVWWCEVGDWSPVAMRVNSPHNSQHLFDAYSLSHVLHGILFFGMLWPLRGRFSLPTRAAVAAAVEIGWELLENSPVIINRYRAATVSLGYPGDSFVNSLGDIASFVLGFYVARKVGFWWSCALFATVELLMLWLIRDNLALNVLMLLWPIDAIRQWQSGGG